MRTFLPLLLTGVLLLGGLLGASCSAHSPPVDNGDETNVLDIDEDVVVEMVAGDLVEMGEMLEADARTFGECIAGVVLQAAGEHTTAVAIPIKQAVEADECMGYTDPVIIDPSGCVGLPGTPTDVEGVDAAREEVERTLIYTLPAATSGLELAALLAAANGDTAGCTVLTYFSDLMGPTGELVTSILGIIEEPGAPFEMPGASWDCTQCS